MIKNLQIYLGKLRSENPKVEIKVSKHILRKPKKRDGKSCRKYAMTAMLSSITPIYSPPFLYLFS